jgi:hypothetical protein
LKPSLAAAERKLMEVAPSRVRGLKHQASANGTDDFCVAPSRVRGIETLERFAGRTEARSRTFRLRD